MQVLLVLMASFFLLSACGGGGGDGSSSPNSPVQAPPTDSGEWTAQTPTYQGIRTPIQVDEATTGQRVVRILKGIDLIGSLMFGENYDQYSLFPPSTQFNLGDIEDIICTTGTANESALLSADRVRVTYNNCTVAKVTINGTITGFVDQNNQVILNTNLDLNTTAGVYNLRGHLAYLDDFSATVNLAVTDNSEQPSVTYLYESFFIDEFGYYHGDIYASDAGRFELDIANIFSQGSSTFFEIFNFDQNIKIDGLLKERGTVSISGANMPVDLSQPYVFSSNNRAPVIQLNISNRIKRTESTIFDLSGSTDPDIQPLDYSVQVLQGSSQALSIIDFGEALDVSFDVKGEYELEITATDPLGASVSEIVNVMVLPKDAEITITNSSSQSTNSVVGEITIENEDLDGPFSVTLEEGLLGLNFDTTERIFEWTPPFNNFSSSQSGNFTFLFDSQDSVSENMVTLTSAQNKLFAPKILRMSPGPNARYVNVGNKLYLIESNILTEVIVNNNTFEYRPLDFTFDELSPSINGNIVHVSDINNDNNIELWFEDSTGFITVVDTANKSTIRNFAITSSYDTQYINMDINNDGFNDILISSTRTSAILFGPLLGSAQDIVNQPGRFANTKVCDINNDGIFELGNLQFLIDITTNERLVESNWGTMLYFKAPSSDNACKAVVANLSNNQVDSFSIVDLRDGSERVFATAQEISNSVISIYDYSMWTQNTDDDPDQELVLTYYDYSTNTYALTVIDDIESDSVSIFTVDSQDRDFNIKIEEYSTQFENEVVLQTADGNLINGIINHQSNDTVFNAFAIEALEISTQNDQVVIETIATTDDSINLDFLLWEDNQLVTYSQDTDKVVVYDTDTNSVSLIGPTLEGQVDALMENGNITYYHLIATDNVDFTKYDANFNVIWQQAISIAGVSSEEVHSINDDVAMLTRDTSAILLFNKHTGDILYHFNYASYASYGDRKPVVYQHNNKQFVLLLDNNDGYFLSISSDNQVLRMDDARLNGNVFRSIRYKPMQLDNDTTLEFAQIFTDDSGNNSVKFIDESAIESQGALFETQPWDYTWIQSRIVQHCVLLVPDCAQFLVANTMTDSISIHDSNSHEMLWQASFENFGSYQYLIRKDPNLQNKYQMLIMLGSNLVLVE